jgi:hypothetical protein
MSAADQARSLVASILNGDLAAVTRTAQRHDLRFTARVLPLRNSPATAVSAVTIDGDTVDASDYTLTPHSLVREDGLDWPLTPILVTYTTGWVEGEEPQPVQDAIDLAEGWLTGGADITSYRAGAEAVTRDSGQANATIKALVAPWVRP